MLLDLSDRVVVVTGAARGIGRALAEAFLAEGSTVVALDLPGEELFSFGPHVADGGGTALYHPCDVSDSAQIDTAIGAVVGRLGRIDVLVNNAGVNALGLVEEIRDDLWDRCFDVNVGGVFRMCRAVVPHMKARRSGRIINAASFAAIVPSVGASAYAASKAAVVQFTRTLAGELGPWGITANSYAPGMVPTAINGFTSMPQQAQEELLDTLTLRRWETPEDVARLVCFLASDAAAYITGTLVDVSGGKLATQIPSRAYAGG
ncbi:SDR family NAD(P)-dependent oxidoreductase [Microbacterium tumbae]